VLVSGGGRSLENLADRIRAGALHAEIALVVSNTADAPALERAKRLGLPHAVVSHREFPEVRDFSTRIFAALDEARCDLAVLAGFLRLLSVPDPWIGRVINIHPALLPAFGGKGFYGHRVHEAVLARGVQYTGCTVHYVTNEYDAGPILLQRCIAVRPDDTADTLAARVFEEEKLALPEAIELHLDGAVRFVDGRVERRRSGAR
jgi:formyltetrahydrofolate-dependent phosphoribosylglycinamide formyltransferase